MKDYKLTRAMINMDMVKDINGKKEFPLGENKIGYVRLMQFGEKTSDDLEAALEEAQGARNAGADSGFALESRADCWIKRWMFARNSCRGASWW